MACAGSCNRRLQRGRQRRLPLLRPPRHRRDSRIVQPARNLRLVPWCRVVVELERHRAHSHDRGRSGSSLGRSTSKEDPGWTNLRRNQRPIYLAAGSEAGARPALSERADRALSEAWVVGAHDRLRRGRIAVLGHLLDRVREPVAEHVAKDQHLFDLAGGVGKPCHAICCRGVRGAVCQRGQDVCVLSVDQWRVEVCGAPVDRVAGLRICHLDYWIGADVFVVAQRPVAQVVRRVRPWQCGRVGSERGRFALNDRDRPWCWEERCGDIRVGDVREQRVGRRRR